MIKSFGDKESERLFLSGKARRLPSEIVKTALRKLDYLNAAVSLEDLRVPSGNRLEALKGDRKGYWSIRINQQYRVVFRFENGHAYEVSVVDYH